MDPILLPQSPTRGLAIGLLLAVIGDSPRYRTIESCVVTPEIVHADYELSNNAENPALPQTTSVPGGSSNMSVAACTAACGAGNYNISGLLGSGQCCKFHFEYGPTTVTLDCVS